MAAQIAGLDYYELDFSANGTLTSDGGLLAATAAGGIQDLYLLSHGWNSTPASARSLYQAMFTLLAGMIPGEIGHSAAVGIIWPSVVFPDDDPATAPPQPSTGQQASVEGATAAVFGYAAAMSADPASGEQGILDPFSTLWHGAREVLRDMSYYEMKNRAGVIGRAGLGPLLGRLAAAAPGLRVHLMGHSFGARLVAYALSGLPPAAAGANSPVRCLLLIQGAFSHFSFADPVPCAAVSGPGALAVFARNVNGPLLATFSAADRALGWWYPAASMLAQQNAESVADLSYEWGAMGHDGYQQSPPGTTVKLAAPGTAAPPRTS